jgi:hypothetical protein
MGSIFTDDRDTVHVIGVVDTRTAAELRRMVHDAFLMHDGPVTTLTLAFDGISEVAADAVGTLREALGDAVAVCAERGAALRIVPAPALRRLDTAG